MFLMSRYIFLLFALLVSGMPFLHCEDEEETCNDDIYDDVEWVEWEELIRPYPAAFDNLCPGIDAADTDSDCEFAIRHGIKGIWMPEDPVLFRPFVADPRAVDYSVGWRFNDRALGKNLIDVSYGDTFVIYRWCELWCGIPGEMQIELEGALWALFDPLHDSSPLVNADYYVGALLTYAYKNWSWRTRLFHISSHIGDEFLLDHPYFNRKNPSAEYLDFFVSNQITDEIRLFSGAGWVLMQDDSFHIGKVYIDGGFEVRLPQLGFKDACDRLYGEPFYGTYFHWRHDLRHHLDATYVIGYEIGKTSGLCRVARAYLEYHDGYSWEGQFVREATRYLSLRLSYGF